MSTPAERLDEIKAMFRTEIDAGFAQLKEVQIRQAVATLNEALALDRYAISAVMFRRVLCNRELTDHPTIQCSEIDVGALGIINGILEPITGRRVMSVTCDETNPPQILRFEIYPGDPAATRAAAPAQ